MINAMKLALSLQRQANQFSNFAKATDPINPMELTINGTVSMVLYALSIAIIDSMARDNAEPLDMTPIDEAIAELQGQPNGGRDEPTRL